MKIVYQYGAFEFKSFADAEANVIDYLKSGHLYKLPTGSLTEIVPIRKVVIDDNQIEKVVGTFYITPWMLDKKSS